MVYFIFFIFRGLLRCKWGIRRTANSMEKQPNTILFHAVPSTNESLLTLHNRSSCESITLVLSYKLDPITSPNRELEEGLSVDLDPLSSQLNRRRTALSGSYELDSTPTTTLHVNGFGSIKSTLMSNLNDSMVSNVKSPHLNSGTKSVLLYQALMQLLMADDCLKEFLVLYRSSRTIKS